jgi:predicted transcriptional regulator
MPETKNLLLRLDPELASKLQAVAAAEERSVSDLVREAITSHIEAKQRDKGFQRRLRDLAKAQQKVLDELQRQP